MTKFVTRKLKRIQRFVTHSLKMICAGYWLREEAWVGGGGGGRSKGGLRCVWENKNEVRFRKLCLYETVLFLERLTNVEREGEKAESDRGGGMTIK